MLTMIRVALFVPILLIIFESWKYSKVISFFGVITLIMVIVYMIFAEIIYIKQISALESENKKWLFFTHDDDEEDK